MVESLPVVGGEGVNTGTLPSKTLKESALFFSVKYDLGLHGLEKNLEQKATIDDFFYRERLIQSSVEAEVLHNLKVYHVELLQGLGSFIDEHHISVNRPS